MQVKVLASILAVLMGCSALPSQAGVPAVLTGQLSQEKVADLTTRVHWDTDLNSALREAQREKKMVLWIHMLGSLSGAT
jgi:hypothetical protein